MTPSHANLRLSAVAVLVALSSVALAQGAAYLPGPGHGFGLGFAVRQTVGMSPMPGSVGDYAWGGLWGTYFWVDPKEKLFAIWMMQSTAYRAHYRPLIRSFVLQSIVDPPNGE
jgi:CubicO group peptidase (beta-lactamase class C family)